jgi:hypothetical protein
MSSTNSPPNSPHQKREREEHQKTEWEIGTPEEEEQLEAEFGLERMREWHLLWKKNSNSSERDELVRKRLWPEHCKRWSLEEDEFLREEERKQRKKRVCKRCRQIGSCELKILYSHKPANFWKQKQRNKKKY